MHVSLFRPIVTAVRDILLRFPDIGAIVSAVIYFAFCALDWCNSDEIPFRDFRTVLTRGCSTAEINRDTRIYLLVAKVYAREGQWLDLDIGDYLSATFDPKLEEPVRYCTAYCLHQMLKSRPEFINQMNNPSERITARIIAEIEDLNMRVRYCMAMVLFACARGCTFECLPIFACEKFVSVCQGLLEYQSTLINLAFIGAWDFIFTMYECNFGDMTEIMELFLSYFPSELLYGKYVDTRDEDEKSAWWKFWAKWFRGNRYELY
jgi:hypothetical protein